MTGEMSSESRPLSALLAGVDGAVLPAGAGAITVAEVRDDSRQVQPGDLFVAVPGTLADGRTFIAAAIARGARVVVTEGPPVGSADAGATAFVTVASARQALAVIAANRFGAAAALDLMAVTGTNGKTTTTYLVEAMLAATGLHPGVIGTVSYRSAAPGWTGGVRAASLTTPGPLALHALFAEMRAAGTTDVVLEASSQALDQRRLDGCRFRVAALTNVTQDHLDYHGSMDRYFDAKAVLFERLLDPGRGVAVFMVDDDAGRKMRRRVRGLPTLGVTLKAVGADIAVAARELSAAGTRARFRTPVGDIGVESPLVGEFNLSNIALAVGMGVGRGLPPRAIAAGVGALATVPGRLERVANERGVLCVVDYAHTPDALERAIAALRPLTRHRLLVVFGCGGDRDRGKRPLMGEVAARDGDLAIVTSDNPRTEDPASIVEMVADGARRALAPALEPGELAAATRGYLVEIDRRAALRLAAAAARPGDTLLVAGKGHEDYQIVGTTKLPFDDRLEAAAALRAAADEAGQ